MQPFGHGAKVAALRDIICGDYSDAQLEAMLRDSDFNIRLAAGKVFDGEPSSARRVDAVQQQPATKRPRADEARSSGSPWGRTLAPSPAKHSPTQHAAELRSAELRAGELRAAELRAAELRAAELRAAELHAAELRAAEQGAPPTQSWELRALERAVARAEAAEAELRELRAAELRAAELCAAELRAAGTSGIFIDSQRPRWLTSGGNWPER